MLKPPPSTALPAGYDTTKAFASLDSVSSVYYLTIFVLSVYSVSVLLRALLLLSIVLSPLSQFGGHHCGVIPSVMSLVSPPASSQLKKTLRSRVRASLKNLSLEETESKSKLIIDRLLSCQAFTSSRNIACFVSMPNSEVNTSSLLIKVLANSDQSLYVPRVGPSFVKPKMEMVKVPSGTDISSWPKNKWGIPEPPEGSLSEIAGEDTLDLIIVPGVAFDKWGGRCGHGKGYYDRFIAGLAKKPRLIGVAFDVQLLGEGEIPMDEHDVRVDEVFFA